MTAATAEQPFLRTPGALVALLVVTSVLGMLGVSSFSALLPAFERLWGLSHTESGWISGIFFAGYVAAVPLLVGATDRVDPRRIYLISLVIGAVAALGYAFLAQGFWTACGFRALGGIGLAGTYMPGLKLMTDRTEGPKQSRYVAFYTGGFSLGTAVSFAFTGEVAQWLGWRAAFAAGAAGSALAFFLIRRFIAPTPRVASLAVPAPFLDFRPVLRNRAAMAFVFGYTGHVWELFALRAWLVAFLLHAATAAGDRSGIASVNWLATVIVLLSTLASLYGAELAARADRRRVIGRIMILSVLAAAATGLSPGLPLSVVVALCLAYNMLIMADSAALTGGAVLAAMPGQRGATLAVYTVLGFSGAFLGPLAVGAVMDLAGGEGSGIAWTLGFLTMGLGSAAALLAIRRL